MASQRKGRRGRRRRHGPPGASPGTLFVDPAATAPELRAWSYGPSSRNEQRPASVAEVAELRGQQAVLWVNVDGLGDAARIEAVGELFGLHRLALEDVVNRNQRPKLERYDSHHFAVLHMPSPAESSHGAAGEGATAESGLSFEQLAIFWGTDWVLTFQERAGDCLDPVRARLAGGKGRLPTSGADYLVYALMDAVVDAYFPVLERLADRLEHLEDSILAGRGRGVVGTVHTLRRDLLAARRSVWPLRELVAAMAREDEQAVSPETRVYLRDCQDHVVQLIDMAENLRDLASGLMEVHLSLAGYRMNEIMKVLTIIATIFIPLTFVCGVYGMNFDTASPWNLPELGWRYGYPLVMGAMGAVAVALLIFFKRKGWLGEPGSDPATLADSPATSDARPGGPA